MTDTCTPQRQWYLWPTIAFFNLVFPASIIAVMWIGTVESFTGSTAALAVGRIAASLGYAGGMVFWIFFMRWEFDRWYFKLNDSALVAGKHENKVYPLQSISRIIPGLPEQVHPVVALNKFTNPGIWNKAIEQRKRGLLVQFHDGRMLPLHLHSCVGGTKVMNTLINRCLDQLDLDYQYAPEETKSLQWVNWNRMARKKTPRI